MLEMAYILLFIGAPLFVLITFLLTKKYGHKSLMQEKEIPLADEEVFRVIPPEFLQHLRFSVRYSPVKKKFGSGQNYVYLEEQLKYDNVPLTDWIKSSGAAISIGADPEEAVRGADCVVTDTWVSMGDRNGTRRHNLLRRYQVNGRLMARAKPDAIFMHCLPAHRGEEVTDEVMDGPRSVVFDEAENRLHAQKGILTWCLAPGGR